MKSTTQKQYPATLKGESLATYSIDCQDGQTRSVTCGPKRLGKILSGREGVHAPAGPAFAKSVSKRDQIR